MPGEEFLPEWPCAFCSIGELTVSSENTEVTFSFLGFHFAGGTI